METIYLRKSTEKLSIREGQLIHWDREKELNRYPVCATDQIAVYGNGQITTQAVKECLKEGVGINYFNIYGKFLGRVEPDRPKNVRRRLAQYQLYLDPERRKNWVRALLKGKLQGEIVELRRLREQGYPLNDSELRKELKKCQKQLEKAESIPEMRGIEGTGARKYYEIFTKVLPPGAEWKGRSSHPAEDKVNAVLSYIYVLTAQRIRQELENRSLDVHCGFLHEPGYGCGGLDYDLLELFRATWCDHQAIRLMNHVREVQKFLPGQDGKAGLPEEVRTLICTKLREKQEIRHRNQRKSFSEQLRETVEETLKDLNEQSLRPGYERLHPER